MKIIDTDDLVLILTTVHKNRSICLDDLEKILNHFGDDIFIEGNTFVRDEKKNENMVGLESALRSCNYG